MKSIYSIICFILLLTCQSAFSQLFEATGIGSTADLAKKDAVANAIKFSVGEFLVNKEELNNDKFSQKAVSYSNAYVKHIDVKSQQKITDNEYQVSVAVDIESQKLIGALKEMQMAVIENAIDSDILLEAVNHFDAQDLNKKSGEDFDALVNELLVKPIQENKELINIKILGKLTPIKPKENSNTFPLELKLELTPSKEYIAGFERIVKEMKANKGDLATIYVHNLNWNSDRPSREYKVESKKFQRMRKALDNAFYSSDNYYRSLLIELLDKNKEVYKAILLGADELRFIENKRNSSVKEKLSRFSNIKESSLLFLDSRHARYFTGSAKVSSTLNLTKSDIQDLKGIKIYFSNCDNRNNPISCLN
ncbi:Uncharacterised protein [Phocoenobacter uteri]|uniref:LPP20 lipoprotein n=1 Tax=Phocoenobacter uteri TaxID=146806 RepID=A0A379CAK6_9PAST|nr:hypothetical protein [Phocoenobacter uteri]MDG6881377.1 hypothetical protein [Phocoenobacter uteri]SUB59402.1 Uncharacterised protein [Phocoenobacter uteri]